MKRFFLISTLLICTHITFSQTCDPALWKHVYNPARLKVLKQCLTIKGVVNEVKAEPDGDYHIQIKLDSDQPTNLLNDKNLSVQSGCLVVEIICADGNITQTDAQQPCSHYNSKIAVPKKGDHVQVTGTYILDTEADHGWNELHPVSELVILKS